MTYLRLDDVVKADDVSKKGGGNFAADYVNWARIAYYLREHGDGWQPVEKGKGTYCKRKRKRVDPGFEPYPKN